ncbi:hypothetical protein CBS101457_000110 [Exobasidium rhododendri]|nr:hypothetical protein CBS101457_000110 [Exobasidium rhododendri]
MFTASHVLLAVVFDALFTVVAAAPYPMDRRGIVNQFESSIDPSSAGDARTPRLSSSYFGLQADLDPPSGAQTSRVVSSRAPSWRSRGSALLHDQQYVPQALHGANVGGARSRPPTESLSPYDYSSVAHDPFLYQPPYQYSGDGQHPHYAGGPSDGTSFGVPHGLDLSVPFSAFPEDHSLPSSHDPYGIQQQYQQYTGYKYIDPSTDFSSLLASGYAYPEQLAGLNMYDDTFHTQDYPTMSLPAGLSSQSEGSSSPSHANPPDHSVHQDPNTTQQMPSQPVTANDPSNRQMLPPKTMRQRGKGHALPRSSGRERQQVLGRTMPSQFLRGHDLGFAYTKDDEYTPCWNRMNSQLQAVLTAIVTGRLRQEQKYFVHDLQAMMTPSLAHALLSGEDQRINNAVAVIFPPTPFQRSPPREQRDEWESSMTEEEANVLLTMLQLISGLDKDEIRDFFNENGVTSDFARTLYETDDQQRIFYVTTYMNVRDLRGRRRPSHMMSSASDRRAYNLLSMNVAGVGDFHPWMEGTTKVQSTDVIHIVMRVMNCAGTTARKILNQDFITRQQYLGLRILHAANVEGDSATVELIKQTTGAVPLAKMPPRKIKAGSSS